MAGLPTQGTLVLRAGEPFVLHVALRDAQGAPQLLSGRIFSIAVTQVGETAAVLSAPATLSGDALYAIIMITGEQAATLHERFASRAIAYAVIETIGESQVTRGAGRMVVEPSAAIPSDGVPATIDLPYVDAFPSPAGLLIRETGARGLSAAEQFGLGGLDGGDPLTEAMFAALEAPALTAAAAADQATAGAIVATAGAQAVIDDQATNRATVAAAVAQTGADRQAASADRTAADADAAATAADRGAVASDKAITGAWRDQSAQSAIDAGNAAAAALLSANRYPDTASGLAATAAGQYFAVVGTGAVYLTLYRNVAGAAVMANEYPSKAAVDGVSASIAADSTRDDLMHAIRTKSGKAIATFRKGTGWKFGSVKIASLFSDGLTSTTGAFTSLSVSDSLSSAKLGVSAGSLTSGSGGKVARWITASGKVLYDLSAAGVLRVVQLSTSAIVVATATIATLIATTINATNGIFDNLTAGSSFSFPGGRFQVGGAAYVFRLVLTSGKVVFSLATDGTLRVGDLRAAGAVYVHGGELLSGGSSLPLIPAQIGVANAAIEAINAWVVPNRPAGTHDPGVFSNNAGTHSPRFAEQAPSLAIIRRIDGSARIWATWYGQNTQAGAGAITSTSQSFITIAYCDNFDDPVPTICEMLYVVPVNVYGDENLSDPQLFALPDGRLQVTYVTANLNGRARVSYGFLIENPGATSGSFDIGRQWVLDYGVAGQPFLVGQEVHYFADQWTVAQHYSKLTYPDRDKIVTIRISDVPAGPNVTFYETSGHVVSGGRVREFRRTTAGYYTRLSDAGALTWGADTAWSDYPSPDSRACFARSPYSGRVIGAFDRSATNRVKLSLACSEQEGAVGTFSRVFLIEDDPGDALITSAQYPTVAFGADRCVYVIYRYRLNTSQSGIARMIVARVFEDKIADSTALSADTRKVTFSTTISS